MQAIDAITYQVPTRDICRWLQALFGFNDTEYARALDIAPETLRKWRHDPKSKQALDSWRFRQLLSVAELADGVLTPETLPEWIHSKQKALGNLSPVNLLADETGLTYVKELLEDIRTGTPD